MIAGIVLAAGVSRRMGRNKLLLPLGGRPLGAYALSAMAGSCVDEVICVVGFEADLVRGALEPCARRPVRWVVNEEYASGRASSIRAALGGLSDAVAAAVFLPADVPGVTAGNVSAVAAAHHATRTPVVVTTEADGSPSHPVLFGRPLFARLSLLEGDTGGRALLEERWGEAVKVPRSGGDGSDVDTEEAYRLALKRFAGA